MSKFKIAGYIVGGIAAAGAAILSFKPLACKLGYCRSSMKDLSEEELLDSGEEIFDVLDDEN